MVRARPECGQLAGHFAVIVSDPRCTFSYVCGDAFMDFQLIDSGWDKHIEDALGADSSDIRIVCPFIKKRSAERFLKRARPKLLRVITRYNLLEFSVGVSDIAALRLLLESGAEIRGIRNLHAKLYAFGASHVILTSANLTEAGLLRNHELGFVSNDLKIGTHCLEYFDNLWRRAGQNLTAAKLTDFERKVTTYLARGAPPAAVSGLGDEGVDIGIPPEPVAISPLAEDSTQAFLKFFGKSDDRSDRSTPILEEVEDSGCHWACTYPKGKRPRRVEDDAVMFMGWFVKQPDDILIYGKAIGRHYEPGDDDASAADIKLRPWKAQWPHYIRVHHAEFVAGPLANGVSLNEMMTTLRSDSFAATQRNAAKREGNKDPRRAYRQQAAVELSAKSYAWLSARLEDAFVRHGKLALDDLPQLDWPTLKSR